MARKANPNDLHKLNRAIYQNQGQKSGFFARRFGWSREKTNRHLVSLNDDGYLYFEDESGRLYPFDSDDTGLT